MTKHRLNEDDATTILPKLSLPATVEELAAQEREPAARRSRRPVVIVAAVTAVLTTAATGWALAQPADRPVAPPNALPTAGSRGYVDGFGAVSEPAEPPSRSLPRGPGALPSASPSAAASPSGAPLSPGQSLAPSALVAGSQRSLRAADRPDRFVRQGNGLASLASVSLTSSGGLRQAATFTVVAGLADKNCFSFVGVDGGYLRHRDWRIRHEQSNGSQLFREDATFCLRPGAIPGAVYLESYNYRGYYVHLRGDELWIDRWRDRDDRFDRECAFAVTAPWG